MMNDIEPIVGTSVSEVWTEVFRRLMHPGTHAIGPVMVTVEGLEKYTVEENSVLRRNLDAMLVDQNGRDTNTVANTVFPKSLWNPNRDRKLLYERFLKNVWPAIRRENPSGHYFQRMISYANDNGEPINQLEHVISTWKDHGNHRHSALQLSIFNPLTDHKHNRILGFPCLHQVCFTPIGPNGRDGLAVTGFYATQYVVPKAYGNYLGLIRLGQFVSKELGLQLCRMTCIAAKAVLGDEKTFNPTAMRPFYEEFCPGACTPQEKGKVQA